MCGFKEFVSFFYDFGRKNGFQPLGFEAEAFKLVNDGCQFENVKQIARPFVQTAVLETVEFLTESELANDIVECPEEPVDHILTLLGGFFARGAELGTEKFGVVLHRGLDFCYAGVEECWTGESAYATMFGVRCGDHAHGHFAGFIVAKVVTRLHQLGAGVVDLGPGVWGCERELVGSDSYCWSVLFVNGCNVYVEISCGMMVGVDEAGCSP